MTDETKPKALRGFACLTPERRAEIARMGGAATPPEKRSFSLNKDLAAAAGAAGGRAPRKKPV